MSIQGRITKAKLEQAIQMLKSKSPEELSQKFDDKSRKDILSKLNEIDRQKLAEMQIDPQAVMSRLTPEDMENVQKIAGKDAGVLMKKLQELLGGRGK